MPTFIVHMNPTFAAAKHPRSQVFEQVSLSAAYLRSDAFPAIRADTPAA